MANFTLTSASYWLLCVVYYLIGSIPTAYLVLKFRHQLDIRNEGTGNVGAMNSYDVTGSKSTGIVVFIVDFLKGIIPALILIYVLNFSLYFLVLPLALLVLGHNFSCFIKFKGGRGLATSAGIFLVVNFWLVVLWLIFYFVVKKIKDNVHIATSIALILLPLIIIFAQDLIVRFTYGYGTFGKEITFTLLFALSSSIVIIILLKHINPIFELITNHKK
ncbi:MAG: glycerol-3-phosphate acyltransferase [Ignavibacteria bacterium]|nr:glycerol-3-phosphate acyltransferase [Ignavibacteria bacterium]